MDKPRILIIEDDEDVRAQMKWALNADYEVHLAEDRRTALEVLQREKPGVVTLDLGLPPSPSDTREGFLALSDLLQMDPHLKLLVITGQHQKESGMLAIGLGAFDFFSKPVNIDALKVVLDRAIHVQDLERGRRELLETDDPDSFEGIIGEEFDVGPPGVAIEVGSGWRLLGWGSDSRGEEKNPRQSLAHEFLR